MLQRQKDDWSGTDYKVVEGRIITSVSVDSACSATNCVVSHVGFEPEDIVQTVTISSSAP